MQFIPSSDLIPYVKSYSVITIDRDLRDEVFYPSGYIDFVVNISEGSAATTINGRTRKTPAVELLGHITMASKLTVSKGTSILIARILPHAGSLFFDQPISAFTNYATNACEFFSPEINDFHDKVMESSTIWQKIRILDAFLVQKLRKHEKMLRKTLMIEAMCRHICTDGVPFDIRTLSYDYGVSERYIQKLFLDVVGIAPGSLFIVNRFNKGLDLVLSSDRSLTSVGYDCGYYDQAHFIREFKKFTGITPAEARASLKKGPAFQQAVNVGF